MTAAPIAPADATTTPPRWGMGDAVLGWVIAQACAALALILVLQPAFGYSAEQVADKDVSLGFTSLTFPPLWLGFIGVPVWVAAVKGRGWVADYRVRLRAIDLPAGAVAGLAAQFLLVPLLSFPVLWLTGTDTDRLSEPARELADKATTPGGVLLLFLMVGIGAPIAEELFFRGLLLRAIEKRFGTTWAVVGSSVVFGATHFQALQFLALTGAGAVFALLTVRTGRLGPAIVAHMAFNTATVTVLVWFT